MDIIDKWQKNRYEKYGTAFYPCIVMSGIFWQKRDFPEEERYDGYIQLENGVGMMRLLAGCILPCL